MCPLKIYWKTQKKNSVKMLYIVFGDKVNAIYHPPTYFDTTYRDEWIIDPKTIEMIKNIDKSDVLSTQVIISPFLGSISPQELSGSVKTLILMRFDDSGKVFNASVCGDDCAKWIYEISKEKDLIINLHHTMGFSSCNEFNAFIVNTHKFVKSYDEYLDEAMKIEKR